MSGKSGQMWRGHGDATQTFPPPPWPSTFSLIWKGFLSIFFPALVAFFCCICSSAFLWLDGALDHSHFTLTCKIYFSASISWYYFASAAFQLHLPFVRWKIRKEPALAKANSKGRLWLQTHRSQSKKFLSKSRTGNIWKVHFSDWNHSFKSS